ncbi:hypothetical protein QC760_004501 [Botrytis cinerea]
MRPKSVHFSATRHQTDRLLFSPERAAIASANSLSSLSHGRQNLGWEYICEEVPRIHFSSPVQNPACLANDHLSAITTDTIYEAFFLVAARHLLSNHDVLSSHPII